MDKDVVKPAIAKVGKKGKMFPPPTEMRRYVEELDQERRAQKTMPSQTKKPRHSKE